MEAGPSLDGDELAAAVDPVASDAAVAVATDAEEPSMCSGAADLSGCGGCGGREGWAAAFAASDGLDAVASWASPRSGKTLFSRVFFAALVAIVERGLVAVVAVGDHEFLIGHGFVNGSDALGLPDDPEAMDDVVLVGEFGGGGGFGFGLLREFCR